MHVSKEKMFTLEARVHGEVLPRDVSEINERTARIELNEILVARINNRARNPGKKKNFQMSQLADVIVLLQLYTVCVTDVRISGNFSDAISRQREGEREREEWWWLRGR